MCQKDNHNSGNTKMTKLSNKERLQALRGTLVPQTNNNQSFNTNYYPFFAMDFDEKSVVRFLPDLNEDNPRQFLQEKLTHTLTIDGVKKNVPCMKMYGETECPICTASAAEYKKVPQGQPCPAGKALYRKQQHLAQVIVIEDPLKYKEDEEPALGQVKLINMSWMLFNKLTAAFDDDELEDLPYDFENGTDFVIKKTKNGEYASYDNSKFKRDVRPLTAEELAVVESSMIDLSTLLPAKPTVEMMHQYLQGHITGSMSGSAQQAPAQQPAVPAEESAAADGVALDAQAILASIRARQAQ